jgi:alpha-glucosidase
VEASTSVAFDAASGTLEMQINGNFGIEQRLASVTLLGVETAPSMLLLSDRNHSSFSYDPWLEAVEVNGLDIDMNERFEMRWV